MKPQDEEQETLKRNAIPAPSSWHPRKANYESILTELFTLLRELGKLSLIGYFVSAYFLSDFHKCNNLYNRLTVPVATKQIKYSSRDWEFDNNFKRYIGLYIFRKIPLREKIRGWNRTSPVSCVRIST